MWEVRSLLGFCFIFLFIGFILIITISTIIIMIFPVIMRLVNTMAVT